MRWSLALLLAGCVTPAPRVVPGWAPRAAAASPRVGATRAPRLEVDAEAVWWRAGDDGAAREALVALATVSSVADRSAATAPHPLSPPVHVPAHDQQLGLLQQALSGCAADGGPLEVAGSFAASSGRFVAARPITGSPGARACAERALGAVTLAPPQFARIDLVWRLPLLVEPAAADDALARRAYARFAARSRPMRACYEAALRTDVQLGGRVEVEALVAGSGVVLAVTTRSPPPLGEAAACIAGVLAASDGGEATGGSFALTFPIALRAAQ